MRIYWSDMRSSKRSAKKVCWAVWWCPVDQACIPADETKFPSDENKIPLGEKKILTDETPPHISEIKDKKRFSLYFDKFALPLTSSKLLALEKTQNKFWFSAHLFVTFLLVEDRLHLRKTQINLVFHSICTTFAGANEEYDNESCSFRPGRRGI